MIRAGRVRFRRREIDLSTIGVRLYGSLSFRVRRLSERIDSFRVGKELSRVGADSVGRIRTWTTRRELRALSHLAKKCPKGAIALEVGSYLGASACYLVAGLSQVQGHLYCVDTWQNETMSDGERDTFAEFESNTYGIRKWISPVRKRMDELLETDVAQPLDLVFIDGDHSYDAVKHDFHRTSKWLAEKGVIAFHDCVTHQGVSRLIGEVLASGEWRIEGKTDNLLWIRRAEW